MKTKLIRKILNNTSRFTSRISEGLRLLENRSVQIKKGGERSLYKNKMGNLYWLDKSRYIDKCIIDTGVFEEDSTNAVIKLLKDGDVALDIGANIGYYSIMMAKIVRNGKVICFEPTKKYFKILSKNVNANKLTNVQVYNFALSNRIGKFNIFVGSDSATMHPINKVENRNKETINTQTLDSFVSNNNIKDINFIKIDIDGHEPLFFEGAEKTLNTYKPIIIMEISHQHFRKAGYLAWDFYKYLKDNGYHIYDEKHLSEIYDEETFLILCGNFCCSANIIICKKKIF